MSDDAPKTPSLVSKTRQLVALKPAEMEAKGLPPTRAAEKFESTTAGWLAAVLGLFFLASAVYLAVSIAQSARDISVMVVVLVCALGGLGFAVFAVGMTLISRDASPAIAGAGELIVKVIRAIRGGGGVA